MKTSPEAFAYLLTHILDTDENTGLDLLLKLSGLSFTNKSNITINTQQPDERAFFDIFIHGEQKLIIIESKLTAKIEIKQVAGYEDILKSKYRQIAFNNKRLVLLTKYKIPNDVLDQDTFKVRWFEVANWLTAYLAAKELTNISHYLVEEFVDFLNYQGCTVPPVTSNLSYQISEYLKNYGEHIVQSKRIYSIDDAILNTELHNLVLLLKQMKFVCEGRFTRDEFSFQSGIQDEYRLPWIGFSLENKKYYFYLYLTKPETIIFQLYGQTSPLPTNIPSGQIKYRGQEWDWFNYLHFEKNQFFVKETNPELQLHCLEDFLNASLEMADSLLFKSTH